ncbi:MAG: ribonuclease P protein component [Planctomycetota bacterium]|nr:ribonuclease P protein component [Planctomycetota bacterium]
MLSPSEPDRPLRSRLPRALRLRSSRQFRAVYEARVSHRAGPLVIYACPNGLDQTRLGLSVPRRAGGAVRRNRIRRLLREAFRLQRRDLPSGYDVVVNVRPHESPELGEYQRQLAAAMRVLDERWSKRRNKAGESTRGG